MFNDRALRFLFDNFRVRLCVDHCDAGVDFDTHRILLSVSSIRSSGGFNASVIFSFLYLLLLCLINNSHFVCVNSQICVYSSRYDTSPYISVVGQSSIYHMLTPQMISDLDILLHIGPENFVAGCMHRWSDITEIYDELKNINAFDGVVFQIHTSLKVLVGSDLNIRGLRFRCLPPYLHGTIVDS